MRMVKLNMQQSTSLVIDECLIFWQKARIPTRYRCDCVKQLQNLYKEIRCLDKSKHKNSENCRKKEDIFNESLDDLFDISHADALNLIRINEDREFLLLQRQKGRPGCMLGIDLKLTGVEARKGDRLQKEIELREGLLESTCELGLSFIISSFNLLFMDLYNNMYEMKNEMENTIWRNTI